MSIIVSTDVFCDGYDCSLWVHGVSSESRTNKKGAEKAAKRAGWKITSRRHLCPDCAAKETS